MQFDQKPRGIDEFVRMAILHKYYIFNKKFEEMQFKMDLFKWFRTSTVLLFDGIFDLVLFLEF